MGKISIDPGQNGVHSLAMALKAFNNLHADPQDIFSLEDSVMRADHSIETLSKDIIFQINPALLLKEIQSKQMDCLKKGYKDYLNGQSSTMLDECQTIGLIESLELLKDLEFIDISNDDYRSYKRSVEQLRAYRNRAQHFAISADPERVKRILGNTLPQSIEILQEAYDKLIKLDPMQYRTIDIMGYLKSNWPDSLTWLSTLKEEYCDLIQRAITFFRAREFSNQSVIVDIKDSGKVGAPPYYPEIKMDGFLSLNYDTSTIIKLAISDEYRFQDEEDLKEIGWPYNIILVIDQPYIENSTDIFGKSNVKGKFSLNGYIKSERLENVLKLPDAEKEIAILRDAIIKISANIEYNVEAYVNNHHFSADATNAKVNGRLRINLTAFTKGYEADKSAEIDGIYTVDLDETNTSFRLDAFMKPDGKTLNLEGPYNFDCIIKALGDLNFK
jgi:hypothetical protein